MICFPALGRSVVCQGCGSEGNYGRYWLLAGGSSRRRCAMSYLPGGGERFWCQRRTVAGFSGGNKFLPIENRSHCKVANLQLLCSTQVGKKRIMKSPF